MSLTLISSSILAMNSDSSASVVLDRVVAEDAGRRVRDPGRLHGDAEARRRRAADAVLPARIALVGKISAKCCSFSAVSAPIFARKYAFCSIFQNLPDSQAENFEI